jgi:hypothetical protein
MNVTAKNQSQEEAYLVTRSARLGSKSLTRIALATRCLSDLADDIGASGRRQAA